MANQNFKVKKGLEVGTGTTVSVDGINVTGVITATTFAGDGSALTGVTASGTGVVVQEEGSNIGTAATINFIGSNVTAALSGGIANVTVSGGSGGLSNVVEDTTPQLGGNLDLNSKDITGTGNISITGGFNATGVSTFQENVNFTSTASFGDNDKINVGTGNDLQIFHDGTSNIISDAVGAGISLVGNTKVVGVLTATSFSGSLATTDLTGTITNAQLAGSIADGKLASTFLKNVVEDTTPQLGGNLDANSKDIIGVANLNVAGISTFTGNVILNANLDLQDDDKILLGSGDDLQIYHDGSNSYIDDTGTGRLNIRGNTGVSLRNYSNSNQFINCYTDGTVELFYNNSKKFETTTTGVTVTGTLAATAVTGSGSALTGLTGASAGTYGASTNTPIITVDSNGRITGIATVATSGAGGGGGISNIVEDTTPQLGGNLDLNSKSITGTGNIEITGYAGVSGVSTFSGAVGFATHIHDAGTGNLDIRSNLLRIKNDAGSETLATFVEDGAVSFYHDNTLKFATSATGATVTGTLVADGISLGDSETLNIGAGNDISLSHNGTNSFIDNATGSLYIRGANGNHVRIQSPSGEESIVAAANGSVDLYYDNSKKLETTNTGVTVTGTLAATAVTGDGSGLTNLPAPGISTASSNIQVNFDVTASGSSAYRFTGPGNDAADDNPDLYLIRGQRYRFTNNSGGSHPFQIRSAAGGSAYNTGVTNNGGASGNIDFNVQHDAPARLYYQCTSHSAMVGNIYITGGANWQTTSVNTSTAEEIFTLNNIGIGENSPDVRLHVKEQFDTAYSLANVADEANHLLKLENPSSTANAFAGMQFRVGSGADLFFGAIQQSVNHGDFFFANQNSPNAEIMRIKSTGNVGIGTDNPQGKLVVSDGSNGLEFNPNSNNAIVSYNRTTSAYAPNGLQGSTVQIRIGGVGTALHVHSDGNIGIGTDTFTATSSGRQIVEIEGASGSLINFAVGGARKAYHFTDGTDVYSYNTVSGSYIFGTNNTERLRITSSGQFNVGSGSFVVESDGDISTNVRCHGHIELDSTGGFSSPKIKLFSNTGSISASSVNLQSSATSSWFQTGTSIASYPYVWAAKNSSSNVWHSGLQTDGDLYLGGNLAGTNNIALNGSNGSGWFTGGLGIGGNVAANTIDDYEEGSFTATCSNSVTLHSNTDLCQYIKIGNMVTVMGQIRVDGSNGGAGLIIGNLPFVAYNAGESAGFSAGSLRLYDADMGSDHKYTICIIDAGSNNLIFQAVRDNASSQTLGATSDAYYMFNLTYRTS